MDTREPVCDVCKRVPIYGAALFCDWRFKWNSRMLKRGAQWIWTLENNCLNPAWYPCFRNKSEPRYIYTPKAMSKSLKYMFSYEAFDFPLMVWGEYGFQSFLLWISVGLIGESKETWSGLGWSTSGKSSHHPSEEYGI